MAIKKPVTTADLKPGEAVTISLEDRVAAIQELSDPAMVADVQDVKYTKVKSPAGSVTEVPEGILQPLLDSGYSKSK